MYTKNQYIFPKILAKGGELVKRHIIRVAGTLFIALFLLLVLGSKTAMAATNAKVNVPVLNVRSGPSTGYKILTSIKVGQTYPVIDNKNGWYKINMGSTSGWICGTYVVLSNTGTAAPPPVQKPSTGGGTSVVDSLTVKVSLLNVRSSNSVTSSIIGGIRNGSTYSVLDSKSGWYKIQYGTTQGWVCGEYVNVSYKENDDKQDQPQPQIPVTANVYEVQDLKLYKTGTRNCAAIPVTIKVDKGDSSGSINPSYTQTVTPEGKIQITLGNSSFKGINKNVSVADNELIAAVNITDDGSNSTIITLSPKTNANYEAYTISSKAYEDSNYKYYKFYIVTALKSVVNAAPEPFRPGAQPKVTNTSSVSQEKSKKNYLIALDAGHGGTTTGAVSSGMEEKVFNLDIIMRLNDILKAQGYDTYLTREDDTFVSLADRADSANILKSDIFVSVHLNSIASPSVGGTETLCYSTAAPGAHLAELIQKNLISGLNRNDRGIKDRPDLYVLNSTNMPAALAEILFMSNNEELQLISGESTRQKTAESIGNAINEYFGFNN